MLADALLAYYEYKCGALALYFISILFFIFEIQVHPFRDHMLIDVNYQSAVLY